MTEIYSAGIADITAARSKTGFANGVVTLILRADNIVYRLLPCLSWVMSEGRHYCISAVANTLISQGVRADIIVSRQWSTLSWVKGEGRHYCMSAVINALMSQFLRSDTIVCRQWLTVSWVRAWYPKSSQTTPRCQQINSWVNITENR